MEGFAASGNIYVTGALSATESGLDTAAFTNLLVPGLRNAFAILDTHTITRVLETRSIAPVLETRSIAPVLQVSQPKSIR